MGVFLALYFSMKSYLSINLSINSSWLTAPLRLLVIVFLSSLLLSSCSSNGIKGLVEPPKVQVHKVKMGKFNLSGGTATFVLDIQNPNRFPIPLAGFDYGLSLNGVQVAQGDKEHKVTIQGGQSQKVEVPLTLSFGNMFNLLPGLLRSRQIDYKLNGSVHLPWFNIPFSRVGTTALSR